MEKVSLLLQALSEEWGDRVNSGHCGTQIFLPISPLEQKPKASGNDSELQ